MGIEAKFSMDAVSAKIYAYQQKVDKVILFKLSAIGEQCVNHARDLDTYQDQSGDLRSSIGYSIFKDGILKKGWYPGEVESAEVADRAKLLSTQIASKYSGWILVIVAGMNYAAAVESLGYDVLSSAQHLGEQLASQLLKQK